MGKFKEMMIENGCINGMKLCDNCQECFYYEIDEFEDNSEEYDYWSIYRKIQVSSLPESRKVECYNNLIDRMEDKYSDYVETSDLWKELKSKVA